MDGFEIDTRLSVERRRRRRIARWCVRAVFLVGIAVMVAAMLSNPDMAENISSAYEN
ncbi:hypothetical protein [Phaeobacter sp. 22II1-1F12B]|uniref:hypothetical protein n=1 Tax=Phaeobacter sp. 22II1-1F12B TaxID=1317111 RepID=UPI00130372E4|nr:hypothetical protein [Phaeobacter sp. 22II1-1F12B]